MRGSAHIRPFTDLDDGPRFLEPELEPGQRIGRPLRRRRRRLLWVILLLALAFGGTWAVNGHPSTWPVQRWASTLIKHASALYSAIEAKVAEATRPAPATAAQPLPEQPKPIIAERPLLPAPEPPAFKPVLPEAKSPIITGSLPPAAAGAPPPPLPPPSVDKSDPYQVKAEAVGLHPGLSRVLLTRLSETDYRNAGIAIKTALAETPEQGSFLYPRERKAGLALFKVHFVQGAGPECRRYVVTISKDGWATTAFPMEKCGAQYGRRVPVARRNAG